MCFAVCAPLAGLLRLHGIEARVVEGFPSDGDFYNHVWLELPDGRVLDPTADQFADMPPVYLGPRHPAIHHPTPRREA